MSFNSGTSSMVVLWWMSPVTPRIEALREGNDANVIFQVARVRNVQEWLQYTTDI
jgi:hypothetical protein